MLEHRASYLFGKPTSIGEAWVSSTDRSGRSPGSSNLWSVYARNILGYGIHPRVVRLAPL